MIDNLHPNSKCRIFGHRWRTTTSDNYRVCDREKCHAAERLTERGWVRVESRKRTRKHVTPEPIAMLF